MNKKIVSIIMAVTIAFSLTSCSLALADAGEVQAQDQFIGVFITQQHIDLFDFESYLNDNLNSFSGGLINADAKRDKYEGRMYAKRAEKEIISEETGEKRVEYDYIFEVEGIRFFTVGIENGKNSYTHSYCDEGLSDGHTALKVGDSVDEVNLTGTVYALPGSLQKAYYVNSVYQSADGSVYLTGNNGGTSMGGMDTEGAMMSMKLKHEMTKTENGVTKKYVNIADISFATKFPTKTINVVQMNTDSEIVSKESFTPKTVPQSLTPKAETEYIIIETEKVGAENKIIVERQIHGKDSESFYTFAPKDSGIFIKTFTNINWK